MGARSAGGSPNQSGHVELFHVAHSTTQSRLPRDGGLAVRYPEADLRVFDPTPVPKKRRGTFRMCIFALRDDGDENAHEVSPFTIPSRAKNRSASPVLAQTILPDLTNWWTAVEADTGAAPSRRRAGSGPENFDPLPPVGLVAGEPLGGPIQAPGRARRSQRYYPTLPVWGGR